MSHELISPMTTYCLKWMDRFTSFSDFSFFLTLTVSSDLGMLKDALVYLILVQMNCLRKIAYNKKTEQTKTITNNLS